MIDKFGEQAHHIHLGQVEFAVGPIQFAQKGPERIWVEPGDVTSSYNVPGRSFKFRAPIVASAMPEVVATERERGLVWFLAVCGPPVG